MTTNYTEQEFGEVVKPVGVYYIPAKKTKTRRQHKQALLLTFKNHIDRKDEKSTNKTAPAKPSLLKTILMTLFT